MRRVQPNLHAPFHLLDIILRLSRRRLPDGVLSAFFAADLDGFAGDAAAGASRMATLEESRSRSEEISGQEENCVS